MIQFRALAEVFQRLAHTSSNSALVVAAFLSKLSPEEAKAVADLLRGEVAAPLASQEIGIAQRMAVRHSVVDVSQRRNSRRLISLA